MQVTHWQFPFHYVLQRPRSFAAFAVSGFGTECSISCRPHAVCDARYAGSIYEYIRFPPLVPAGRRCRAGSLAAAKTILLSPQALAAPPAGEHVRFGMIGIGMQGSGLLGTAITLPGVECVAAADLYDGRHTLAREITGNPDLPTTRRYHELLERKDIDCIVAAVPDHWHMRVVVDACNAGKDIYCEKPMSHAAEQGLAMVEAASKNSRIVQIGSQRVSSVLCAKARELYHNGAIGDVEMVELTLGRNDPTGAWEYPPPFDLSPANLDWDTWLNDAPKIPFDTKRFARWRCWKEYGTGVGGDLMVHLISGMLFTLGWNEAPRSAQALGGIFRWPDGRNMPDLHVVLFDYHGSRFMSVWAWAPKRRSWRASWDRRAFWTPPASRTPALAATGHRYRAELLHQQLSDEDARRIRPAVGSRARRHTRPRAVDGRHGLQG